MVLATEKVLLLAFTLVAKMSIHIFFLCHVLFNGRFYNKAHVVLNVYKQKHLNLAHICVLL